MAAIETEFQAAQKKYSALFDGATTAGEYEKIAKEHAGEEPQPARWAERSWSLVSEDATDEVAYAALVWLLKNQPDTESTGKVLATIEKHHIDNPKVADVCRDLVRDTRPITRDFLSRAMVKSPSRDVKGLACYGLAKRALADAAYAERLKGGGEQAESLRTHLGDEVARRLATLDPGESRLDAEKLFESVAEQFGDVKYGSRTLGDAARGDLFEMKNLAIGCIAPEIEAEDFDGVPFKLADYRGKVVVLDFWGHW
jgi:hypothetical protein